MFIRVFCTKTLYCAIYQSLIYISIYIYYILCKIVVTNARFTFLDRQAAIEVPHARPILFTVRYRMKFIARDRTYRMIDYLFIPLRAALLPSCGKCVNMLISALMTTVQAMASPP